MQRPLLALSLLAAVGSADELSLAPVADNTLYQPTAESLSNGAGQHLFAGRNGEGNLRRALVRFDVAAALPAGSTITAVRLSLNMSKSSHAGPTDHSLRRVLASWGEGGVDAPGGEGSGAAAQAGDATWDHREFDSVLWSTPGGDLADALSATAPISAPASYTWESTPQLVADVQLWLDQPELAHGWALVGDEGGDPSTRRFDSRENPNADAHPELWVEFVPPPCGVGVQGVESERLGEPANPSALLGGASGAPAVGGLWEPRVDHASFEPNAVLDILVVGVGSTNQAGPNGTVLVDLSAYTVWQSVPAGQPFQLRAPSDCAFVGLTYYAQAASVDASGQYALTNGLDLLLGSLP